MDTATENTAHPFAEAKKQRGPLFHKKDLYAGLTKVFPLDFFLGSSPHPRALSHQFRHRPKRMASFEKGPDEAEGFAEDSTAVIDSFCGKR